MKRLGGWWRLWIVLSGLWGLFVGVIVVLDWPSSSYYANRPLSAEDRKLLTKATQDLLAPGDPPSRVEDKKTPWERYKVPAPDDALSKQDNCHEVLTLPSGQEIELVVSTATDTQREAIARDFARVNNQRYWEHGLGKLGFAFLIWAIPCLLILALAQAGRWIVQGFGKAPGNASR